MNSGNMDAGGYGGCADTTKIVERHSRASGNPGHTKYKDGVIPVQEGIQKSTQSIR